MSTANHRSTASRALLAFIGLAGVLVAAAYGSARHAPAVRHLRPVANPERPPRPRFSLHPGKLETSTTARFVIADREPNLRFECRLDSGEWSRCASKVGLAELAPGVHAFSARAVNRRGRRSRATRFQWQLLEPKPFSIVPRLSGLGALYPGALPVELPLTVANPNSVPIFVTSLRVSAAAGPAGCTSAENLVLGESGASSASPLEVPAGGSASLPASGVSPPTIQLRDLPVNQDACRDARFPLEFSGSARG